MKHLKKYKGKSVSIIGTGDGFDECPFTTDEAWGIGKMVTYSMDHKHRSLAEDYHKKFTLLFNMDEISRMKTFYDPLHKRGVPMDEYIERLNKHGAPTVTSICHPELTNCEPFPFKEVVEQFGNAYFSNSICYMLAYALYHEVSRMELWGVNQVGMIEYLQEKAAVEFWIGLALGMGVPVMVGGPSRLLHLDKNVLYGYGRPFNELKEYFDINYDEHGKSSQ